jgi:hypothetical protein
MRKLEKKATVDFSEMIYAASLSKYLVASVPIVATLYNGIVHWISLAVVKAVEL